MGAQQAARGAGCRDRGRTVTESAPVPPSPRSRGTMRWGPPGPSLAMEWRGIFELHCQRDYASGAIQVGDKMVASSDEDFRPPYTVRTARLISSPLSARTARCMPILVRSALKGRISLSHPKCLVSVDCISDSSRRTSPGGQRWRGNQPQKPSFRPSSATTHDHEEVDFPD
jgi:hypothetical protein